MIRLLGRAAVVAGMAAAVVVVGGGAAAAGGLDVAVRDSVIVVTNRGEQACSVATTTLGTVSVTRVSQGGRPVAPVSVQTGFAEAPDTLAAAGMRTLQPGQSAELPLRVVPVGPTGRAIETVAWSGGAGASGLLYPLRPGPFDVELAYAPPPAGPAGAPPVCGQGTAAGSADPAAGPQATAAGSKGLGRPMVLLAVAGGVVVVTALLVLLLVRRRRRAGAVVVLLAAGTLAGSGRPARPPPTSRLTPRWPTPGPPAARPCTAPAATRRASCRRWQRPG